jgi:hypothetical protein
MFYEDNIHYVDKFQMVLDSWLNWNLEMLIFAEGGKWRNLDKIPQSKGENQQTTQLTYDAELIDVLLHFSCFPLIFVFPDYGAAVGLC